MGRIISFNLSDTDRPKGRLNRKVLDATTEKDIEQHAAADEAEAKANADAARITPEDAAE